jgi:protein arginine kinase activator
MEGFTMKKCDICGEKPATIKVRQVDKDGKSTEVEVCADCAREKGISGVETIKVDITKVLAEIRSKVDEEDKKLVCGGCGMSFAEFKRLGRLGCSACYTSFAERLEPIVRRIQGAGQHVGKTTKSGRKQARERMSVQRLREDLKSAIHDEDYEKAAELRDQLNRAEENAGS